MVAKKEAPKMVTRRYAIVHATDKAYLLAGGSWIPKSQVTVKFTGEEIKLSTNVDAELADITMPEWLVKKLDA